MAEGLLSGIMNWLSQPGNAQALGAMSAQLTAAGAPSRDPGASMRGYGAAAQAYGDTLAGVRKQEEIDALRKAQVAKLESETEKERQKTQAQIEMRNLLSGDTGAGAGEARAPGVEAAAVPRGLLTGVAVGDDTQPRWPRGTLMAAADSNPLAVPPAAQTSPLDGLTPQQQQLVRAKALEDPGAALELAYKLKNAERFEIVEDPYGVGGGVGQRSTKTGAISGYQAPDKPSSTEEKHEMLVAAGVDPDTASGIVTGRYVVSRDPISGQAHVIDKATGNRVGGVPAAAAGAVADAETPPKSSLPGGVDYSKGTGTSSVFGWGFNTISDAMGGNLLAPEAEKAMQGLKNLRVRTQTTLQQAVPGRPSNYLMEQLDKLAVQPHSLMMGDNRSYERFQQTHAMIQEEVDRMDRDILAHPENFQPKQIAETRASKSQLQSLLRDYDVVVKSYEKALDKKPALPAAGKRVVGQSYDTPRGKAIWRGEGWELQ